MALPMASLCLPTFLFLSLLLSSSTAYTAHPPAEAPHPHPRHHHHHPPPPPPPASHPPPPKHSYPTPPSHPPPPKHSYPTPPSHPPPPSPPPPSHPPPPKHPKPTPPSHPPPPTYSHPPPPKRPSHPPPPKQPTPPSHPPPPKQPSPPSHPPPPRYPHPPPSHPPAPTPKPPVKPRKKVAVQGVVYCKSCKYRGVDSLLGATPLAGAVVKLECNNTKRSLRELKTTDKNGYFFFMPQNLTTAGSHKCKVSLVSSPLTKCSVPTSFHGGAAGAIPFRKPPVGPPPKKPLPFDLFTVGPFAFEAPKKMPCHY